jgi:hypothetical protein
MELRQCLSGWLQLPFLSLRETIWFRTDELDYCLYFPSRLSGRVPNLTVNGTAKIAVDGRHVYVRDDDGKEWKLSIVTKVARQ